MTRVLLNCRCCKLLHSLLLNILIYNSLSWVNSLTCMRAPGHAGRCVCKQLHGCSLGTRASEVPGNPICTVARDVGSLPPKHRAWEGLQPCLKYQSQVVFQREAAGLVVNWGGQYLQQSLCPHIFPMSPHGQSANRHLSKENCVATSCEYSMCISNLCHQTLRGCWCHK